VRGWDVVGTEYLEGMPDEAKANGPLVMTSAVG
jgi:hypothetical protein